MDEGSLGLGFRVSGAVDDGSLDPQVPKFPAFPTAAVSKC